MSQKFIKTQNKIKDSKSFGKYYAKAVYDVNFIGTEELGEFTRHSALSRSRTSRPCSRNWARP